MRRALIVLLASLALPTLTAAGFNDPARRFIRVTSVPASCTIGDVFVNVGVSPAVYYNCPSGTPVVFGLATPVAAANGGTGQSTYTKGDLLAAPGGTTLNKLSVGTDAQVLTADAASTNGVKWAAAAGGIGGSTGATDNAIIRADGTGGATAQSSAVTIDDSGNMVSTGTYQTATTGSFRFGNLNRHLYSDGVGPRWFDSDCCTGSVQWGFDLTNLNVTSRTVKVVDADGTMVLIDAAQTETNKTFTDAKTGGATPAVSNTTASSCGTTAATIAGNNTTGVITVGATAGTNCTITFTVAAPTRRQCTVTNETTANLSRSTFLTTTTSTVEGTFAASDKISYVCAVF